MVLNRRSFSMNNRIGPWRFFAFSPPQSDSSFRLAVLLMLVATVLCNTTAIRAQSCVLTRLDSPVLSAFDPLTQDQEWELTFAWRYGRSDRHFVGSEEQEERQREGSEVVNSVHLADLALRYKVDSQTSVSVGVPYLMADREGPIRNEQRELQGRELRSSTRGIGDITVVGHRLLWDPETHRRSNVSLGLGIKIPTGATALSGVRTRYQNGEPVRTIETADQSVQPGDGGFGLVLEASGFSMFNKSDTVAGYLSALYILSPESTSGVQTFRSAPGEEVMSIADQYVARFGLQFAPISWEGIALGIGARVEGIPVHDLVGSSDGFRRPGYLLSFEPSVSWTRGVHRFTVSLPIALERNRQASVPDRARGAHGDASFPDYLVLAGYSIRF
jgi:hypothetical protein